MSVIRGLGQEALADNGAWVFLHRQRPIDAPRPKWPNEEIHLNYRPEPIDTTGVKLSDDIVELTELLAKNAHDIWARQRMAEGWRYGPERNDARKEHPSLLPYEELTESEKEYDRNAAIQTLKAIIALGYRIE